MAKSVREGRIVYGCSRINANVVIDVQYLVSTRADNGPEHVSLAIPLRCSGGLICEIAPGGKMHLHFGSARQTGCPYLDARQSDGPTASSAA